MWRAILLTGAYVGWMTVAFAENPTEGVRGTPRTVQSVNDAVHGGGGPQEYPKLSHPYMCGDLDGDSQLSTGDGFRILEWLGGGSEPYDIRGADLNGDCRFTMGDGYQLLNYFGSSGAGFDCDLCFPFCTNC
jgi:hypothetical protein